MAKRVVDFKSVLWTSTNFYLLWVWNWVRKKKKNQAHGSWNIQVPHMGMAGGLAHKQEGQSLERVVHTLWRLTTPGSGGHLASIWIHPDFFSFFSFSVGQNNRNFIFHSLGGGQVQDQGAGQFGSWWEPSSWLVRWPPSHHIFTWPFLWVHTERRRSLVFLLIRVPTLSD